MLKIIGDTKIDFMGMRKPAFFLSLALLVAGLVSLAAHGGPRYSIDFEGGRLIEFAFSGGDISAREVRDALGTIGIQTAEVQHYEPGANTGAHPGVLLRIKESEDTTTESPTPAIIAALSEAHPGLTFDIRREESVGPKIGSELRGRAVQAILYALGAILLYVGIRYEFTFALAAVVALFHDVLITVGIFSLLDIEISLPIVAALLTIAGYSINDTIVVFDRIRERRKTEQRRPLRDIMNRSVNQMLSRTIITSVTTLVTALSLFIFGGSVIHDFSFAIVVGVIIGTYSSVFVASTLVFTMLSRRAAGGKKTARKKTAAATS